MTATRTPPRRPVATHLDDPAAVTTPLALPRGTPTGRPTAVRPAGGHHRTPAVAAVGRSRWPAIVAAALALAAVLALVIGAYLLGTRTTAAVTPTAVTPVASAAPTVSVPALSPSPASGRSSTPGHRTTHPAQPGAPTAQPACLSTATAVELSQPRQSPGDTVQRVSGLRCAGPWAVGLVDVTAGGATDIDGTPIANGITGVYHWTGGSWHAIDRTTVCPGQVPASLRDLACNSN